MGAGTEMSRFGKTIQKAREKAGFGLREAAIKIGINPGYLSSLETNLHKAIPSDLVIRKLSDLLDQDFEHLRILAIEIDPARGMRNRLTSESGKYMLAFYKAAQERNISIKQAFDIFMDALNHT